MTWKEGWRSAMTMSMAQCVMISGIFLMLGWCADSWDLTQVVSYCVPDMFPLWILMYVTRLVVMKLLLPLLYFSSCSICTLHHLMMVLPMLFL